MNQLDLENIIKSNQYDLLDSLPKDAFTPEIIQTYGEELSNNLKKVPLPLRSNKQFADLLIKNKKYDLFLGLEVNFINDYLENITDENIVAELNEYYEEKYESIPETYEYICQIIENRQEIIFEQASLSDLSQDEMDILANKYGDTIISFFHTIPNKLIDNQIFKDKINENIKNDNIKLKDIVINKKYMYLPFLDDNEFIENYEDLIKLLELNDYKCNKYLEQKPIILKTLLDHNYKHYILYEFPLEVYNEVFLNEDYANIFVNLVERIADTLDSSSTILKAVINSETNLITYLDRFSEEVYEEIFKDKACVEKMIKKIDNVPGSLISSSTFLKKVIDARSTKLINDFSKSAYEEVIKDSEYQKKLIKLLVTIPFELRNSLAFLKALIDNKKISFIRKYDDNLLNEVMKDENYHEKMDKLTELMKNASGINAEKTLNELFTNQDYELIKELYFSPYIYLKVFAKYEEINYDRVCKLYKNNNSLFDTLDIRFIFHKYDVITDEEALIYSLYPIIQEKIINLNDKELKIFSLMNQIWDNGIDLRRTILNILNNFKKYKDLIDKIDIDTLNQEQIDNLMLIMQNEKNIYEITNQQELSNNVFTIKRQTILDEYTEKIHNNLSDINTIRKAIIIRLGLTEEECSFIYKRYCKNKKYYENSKGIPSYIKSLFELINDLYCCEDKELLIFKFDSLSDLIADYKTGTILDSSIRYLYSKLYNDNLYQLDDNNLITLETEMPNNKLINELSYNGIHPYIYMMDGDFNLQISALGAYSGYDRPDDFQKDWNRPEIASHGICTSYIGNNQIANARAYHPILGFSNYSGDSLLLSANYDIGSNKANIEYDTSWNISCSFMPPKEMIDNTRHTHNEMVIERLSYQDGKVSKRQPSYVISIIDDINNKYNFMTREQLIDEFEQEGKNIDVINQIKLNKDVYFIKQLYDNSLITIDDAKKIYNVFYNEEVTQCAVDMGIPIVIVDRLKYAKSETAKCDDFYKTIINESASIEDKKLAMEELFLTYFNNMIGCHKYEIFKDKNNSPIYLNNEYYNYFQDENELIDKVINTIQAFNDYDTKVELMHKLISTLEEENEKRQGGGGFKITKDLTEKIDEIKNIKIEQPIISFDNFEQLSDILNGKETKSSSESGPMYYNPNSPEYIIVNQQNIREYKKAPELTGIRYIEDMKLLEVISNKYIPIIDKDTKNILFTEEEFINYRKKITGLKTYNTGEYEFSDNLYFKDLDQYLEMIDNNFAQIDALRKPVINEFTRIMKSIGLTVTLGCNSGGDIELVEAGSTARGTNIPSENLSSISDFDFTVRMEPDRVWTVKSALENYFKADKHNTKTSNYKVRLEGVEIPGLEQKIDLDFSLTPQKEKYLSTEDAISERLESMKEQDYERYRLVLANIMYAKAMLKKAGSYKPARSFENKEDRINGGLGGVGIENWILQHGGSIIDATEDFLNHAEGKQFTEFEKEYAIMDFGKDHVSVSKHEFPHHNFVMRNMRYQGYEKMREALLEFKKRLVEEQSLHI